MKYDNGAAAFWKEADEQSLNCGVSAINRKLYARVVGLALNMAETGKLGIKQLEESSIDNVKELFAFMQQSYPDKSLDEYKKRLAIELSLCVSYWEDGTDVDLAIKGLELLADELFVSSIHAHDRSKLF